MARGLRLPRTADDRGNKNYKLFENFGNKAGEFKEYISFNDNSTSAMDISKHGRLENEVVKSLLKNQLAQE